jgi:DNA polymerase-1
MPPLWIIADVPNLTHINYHGRAGRDARRAFLLTVRAIQTLANEHSSPNHIVWCFDRPPYLRNSLLETYKSNRDPDCPIRPVLASGAERMLRAKFPNVRVTPGIEADDHICAVVDSLSPQTSVLVVSRDRDLHQILAPNVQIYDPVEHKTFTARDFRLEWDVHPTQWVEAKSLAGDATDQIPGITGVGLKTAARYLSGQMNRLLPAYIRCQEFQGTDEYLRNLILTRLPFAGTPAYAPQPGECPPIADLE